MYHFELRKFPHAVSRFNQSEQQVLALVVPWVSEEWVELGERKWNVNETKLTVLEGPELSLQDLAMNRGWRNAQRRSENVTERVLAAARARGGRSAPATAEPHGDGPDRAGRATAELDLLADSLSLELLGALDGGAVPLARVWRLAHARLGDEPASESLALAERAVRSLLARRLVVLRRGDAADAAGDGAEPVADDRVEAALGDVDSWTAAGGESLAIARRA